MAIKYWMGGTATWDTTTTANWAAASPLIITASCSGTTLTTTGSPALVVGMTIRLRAVGTSLGTITGGSGNSWTVSVGGTFASQNMLAATTGTAVPTTADSAFFAFFTSITVTLSGTLPCQSLVCSGSFVGTFAGTGTLTVSGGTFTLLSGCTWSATGLITFTGSPTVTTSSVTIGASITYNAAGGTMTLADALTLASTRTFTLTAGTLNLVSYTLTCGLFSSSNSNTRVIAFGTGNITVNTTGGGTLWTTATTTGLTTTGTQVVNVSNPAGVATTITSGSLSEVNSISFNFTAGYYSLTLTAGSKRNLNFTGFTGTVGNTAQTIYGNMILSNGATFTGGANVWTLGGTTVSTRDVDLANKTALGFPLTFDATDSTFRFLRNTTLATYTWSNGNLNLNGFEVTVATLVRSGSGGVTAGGGRFKVTGNNTTVVNLSGSGTFDDVPVELTYAGGAGTRTISNFGGGGFSLAFSGAATDTVSFSSAATVRNLDTTNFSGTLNFGNTVNAYGSLFFNSSAAVTGASARALNLYGSATQYTLGATTTFPTFNIITFQPASNYLLNTNITSTTAFGILGNAVLDLNGKTVTARQGYGVLVGGNTPTITMSSGTISLNGDSTSLSGQPVWDTTDAVTFSGSGTISCTSASDKFIGPAGRTLPTINQGGTGTLEFGDDGTGTGYVLANLTSTATSNTTIRLAPAVTTTFTNFSLSGTATAQVTLTNNGSGLPVNRATISKASGTVSTSYLTIQNIAATGGATWNAFTTNGNVDGGNNTGWNFSGGTSVTVNVTGVEGICSVGTGTTVSGGARAPPTGVSATATIDGVGVSAGGSISVDPNDVQGNGAVGTVTTSGKANTTLTGISATAAVGTVTTTGLANVTLTGVSATASLGTVIVAFAASVAVTGVEATGSLGTVTVAQTAAVNPTGVSVTGSLGTAIVTGTASATLTGVSATASLGTVFVAANCNALPSGVSATGSLGTLDATGKTNATPTGVSASGAIGTVTTQSSYYVTGVSATASLGNVVISVGAKVSVTGVQATGSITSVLVWGVINDNQTPNWVDVNNSQSVSWSAISDAQTPAWVAVNDAQTVTWVQVSDGNTVTWVQIPT